MTVCAFVGALATAVTGAEFTLGWTHSVERTEWRERWRLEADGLRLVEARVRGSGAGMDPGPGARLEDGWWVWAPTLAAQPELVLAASGDTGGGWRLCPAPDGTGPCRTLGARAGPPVRLAACEPAP